MSSRFTSLLGTNYCPSGDEVAEINDLLVEPTVRLGRLDDEIAALQKSIDKLAKERDSVQDYIDGHRALISGVRCLPLDVLQEMFIACMPTDRYCVMSATEAPVLLGHICSFWRSLSLATPRLWSKLHVVEPTYIGLNAVTKKDVKAAQRLEMMKMWLERSGQCPLSVSLQTDRRSFGAPSGSLSAHLFVQALLPHSARWQHIQCTILDESTLEPLLQLIEEDVPMLQSLSFHQHRYSQPCAPDWTRFRILGGSKISEFSLQGPRVGLEMLLQWNRLTMLWLDSDRWAGQPITSSDEMLHILARCPALQICRVVLDDDPTTAVAATTPSLELGFLQELQIHMGGAAAFIFAHFLDRLSLPQLNLLGLYGERESSPHTNQPESLDPPFFARFFTALMQLSTLQIKSDVFTKASLAALFRTLPVTVSALHIFDTSAFCYNLNATPEPMSPLDDDVLWTLVPSTSAADSVCPNLHTLILYQAFLISETLLLELITARMVGTGSVKPLQNIKVQFHREAEHNVMPMLQPFMQAGLVAEISHFPAPSFSPWSGLPGHGGDLPEDPPIWGLW